MRFKMKHIAFISTLFFSSLSHAGIYSDDLSRCLVESSTSAHKSALVKWMFTSMAMHPDVSSMSSVTPQERDNANRDAANMFVSLMTQTCLEPAKKAIQYEGPMAIQQGFTVFGQVAGQELFTHPDVAQSLSDLQQHIDADTLSSVLDLPQH